MKYFNTVIASAAKQSRKRLWIATSPSAPRNDDRRKSQSGNAVLFILIAVALFGALSYTFMRGSKSGQGNLSANQARIAAQEIINYAQTIERGIDKLRQRGCSESEFNFANTAWTRFNDAVIHPVGHNPLARPDGSCDLFTATGANITAVNFPESYTSLRGTSPPAHLPRPGTYAIVQTSIPGVGTAKTDIYIMGSWVSDQVCMKINDILGVTNLATTAPLHGSTVGIVYAPSNVTSYVLTDVSGFITGKTAFCALSNGSEDPGYNRYFYVLLAR